MPLTSAQIVTLATQIAKCPGFMSQAGQFLNATLQDLCQNYDLDAALGTFTFSFNSAAGQGSGPYPLPADYLRTQVKDGKDEFFYTIQGVPYPLIQVTKAEYDWLVQTPGFQSYPYNYATDLSSTPANLFVWPPASGAYPCVLRYYKLMPDIVTPETSAVIPWFLNTQILIRSVAGQLMGITGDSRQAEYLGDDEDRYPLGALTLLKRYLKNVEDREGAVHTVGKDRRRWGRPFDQLKNTKSIGWVVPLFFACWAYFAAPESVRACTTPCTKTQLTTDINANWPDNTTQQITPAILRSTVLEIVNSYLDANGSSSFLCPTHQFLTAIATLSSYTCTQPAAGDVSGLAASATIDTTNAGNITSGTLPAARLPLTNTFFSVANATPTGTSSASALMLGAGVTNCKLTPTYSGRVKLEFDLSSSNPGGASFGATYSARFGTGSAPANGAAATGTVVSGPFTITSDAGNTRTITLSAVITGLAPGTAYWFDFAQTSNGTIVLTPSYGCNGFEF